MKVILSVGANADLQDIGDHIAQDNPTAARREVRALKDKAMGIGAMPRAFPLLPGFEHRGLRRRVHGSYLILYVVEPHAVSIVGFIHGARDVASLLEGPPPT